MSGVSIARGVVATDGGGSGSGDVVGPSSATDGNTAAFDGITGKLIKDSGVNITSLSTSTSTGIRSLSTGLSTTNSTATSLSTTVSTSSSRITSLSTGLSTTNSTVSALSTSTSTAVTSLSTSIGGGGGGGAPAFLAVGDIVYCTPLTDTAYEAGDVVAAVALAIPVITNPDFPPPPGTASYTGSGGVPYVGGTTLPVGSTWRAMQPLPKSSDFSNLAVGGMFRRIT